MKKKQTSVFFHPLFIAALAILLLNDHFFKYIYPGWITGKLSDVAGLFVFHLFLLQLFSGHQKKVTVFVVLFFVWWKSPFSQPVIDMLNSPGVIIFQRTADYSDFIALTVLFFSIKLFNSKEDRKIRFYPVLKFLVFAICIYSFMATSMIRSLRMYAKRNVKKTPKEIVAQLNALNIPLQIDTLQNDARYTWYSLTTAVHPFSVKSITGEADSTFGDSLKIVLYPQSKRKTRMEVQVQYHYYEPFISSRDSLQKALKNWLKQFE